MEGTEVEYECVPTVISSPLQRRSQVTSSRDPLVVRTTRTMEKPMMNAVKQKMPVRANFFRSSTDAFQRIFVDIRITGAVRTVI